MKQKLAHILKDKLIFSIVKIFLLVMLIYLVVSIWKWRELPPQLPLFYSVPRGTEQLGTPFLLLLLPLFSFLFFAGNLLLASLLYEKERLAAVILVTAGIITACLSLITFIKIVFLIT